MELRILEVLKAKKVTRTELAKRLGITRQGLSIKIRNNISLKALQKIADALDVELVELIELGDGYEHIYNDNGQWRGIMPKCKK